jgi:cytochrome b
MKPFIFTLVNAITLVVMGLWGYFSSNDPSVTAFIPVAAGVILLLLSPGIRNQNRHVAHAAVILTLILFIALFKPLSGSLSRHDSAATTRILIMMFTSLLSLTFYIRSFIEARKQRS